MSSTADDVEGPWWSDPRRLVGSVVVALVALALVVVYVRLTTGSDAPEGNPFASSLPAVLTDSTARQAADSATGADRVVLERIASVPTARWLTPEAFATDDVAQQVRATVDEADRQKRVPLLVVYGITDRDCAATGSTGGLAADDYERWVDAIASAARGAAVVLEPDALATAAQCDLVDRRVQQLSDAAASLSAGGASVYVDAGHSHWIDAATMAGLVKRVGVDHLRGFATNVAAYETDADERTYADAVRADVPGLHYVVDTGRNGAGAGDTFCNPPGRALGQEPARGDGGLDAWLWIKPPGESDGECNGGPAAGEFWVTGALDLAAGAGWTS